MIEPPRCPSKGPALEPHLEQYAEELVAKMLRKDAVDFVTDFADPHDDLVSRLLQARFDDERPLMGDEARLALRSTGPSSTTCRP